MARLPAYWYDTLCLGAGLLAVFANAQAAPEENRTTPGCGPRVLVEYTDDDPDFFIVKNRSPAGWNLKALAIDLTRTTGDLVFDPDDGGPGVGGAASFFAAENAPVKLTGTLPAQDGGRSIGLRFEHFSAGLDFTFSIDLDALHDGEGRTWVLPSDIRGGRVMATFTGPSGQADKVEAAFDASAEADSGAGGCV